MSYHLHGGTRMIRTRNLFAPVLLASIIAAGCRSGSGIEQAGFIAAPAGDGFSVSFQNRYVSSEDAAKDNLFFHSARFTLDRGDLYFTLDHVDTDSRSNFEPVGSGSSSLPPAMEPDPSATTNPAGTPAPATAQRSTTGGTIYRSASARGILRTYKTKPEGTTSYEARQVLDDLRNQK